MDTLVEALKKSFTAACAAGDGVERPVALLWPDPDGQWRGAVDALRAEIPELLILGGYDLAKRTGPVIWLKCVIERTLPDVALPAASIPVLYLPNVGRQTLRAGGECPPLLQPLIELQFRGTVWHQRNGRDWTVEAFLTSEQGLGLDVSLDARTREALLRALPLLINEPLSSLRGRRLEAEDFDRLAVGDPVRDLLMWMNDADGSARRWAGSRWAALCEICRREFEFDPEQSHPRAAGEALLGGGGRWDDVWRRFCEAPKVYPGVARLLRESAPKELFVEEGRQPSVNETEETRLSRELDGVAKLPHADACAKVQALEQEHGKRRNWVWAEIGQSPLAQALLPLSKLAAASQRPFGGADLNAVTKAYTDDGWQCDHAAMQALASPGSSNEVALVARVVRALYAPWLDRVARAYQEAVAKERIATLNAGEITSESDVCIVFVDGLRYDLAQRLVERFAAQGVNSRLRARVTALPTVTATAKPAATPARHALTGVVGAEDFLPVFKDSHQAATSQRLRDWMAKEGVEIIEPAEIRMPMDTKAGGWTECGRFDHLGHTLQGDLPRHLDGEIEALVERIQSLLNGGWKTVRVVTDHGWLLLPGGLPRIELPHYLVASKWARCATVKGESATSVPEFGWFWNPDVRIAVPPGINTFVAGNDYAHGGLSPQECITPDLWIERSEPVTVARIKDIAWRGLRCRVQVEGAKPGLRVDLRLNWKQPGSSIAASAKEMDAEGVGSLAVKDDAHEGAAATVVIFDESGQVIDHQNTTVGESS